MCEGAVVADCCSGQGCRAEEGEEGDRYHIECNVDWLNNIILKVGGLKE